MNSRRFSPAGMGSRNSRVMVPGYLPEALPIAPGIQRHRHAGNFQHGCKAPPRRACSRAARPAFCGCLRGKSGSGGPRQTLCPRHGSCAERIGARAAVDGDGGRLPQIPAVKRNAQQFALQARWPDRPAPDKAPACPTCSYAWRPPARRLWARRRSDAHAECRQKSSSPTSVARAQCRAIHTVALRGNASSGRKMIAITAVSRRNQAMNRAERRQPVMSRPCWW